MPQEVARFLCRMRDDSICSPATPILLRRSSANNNGNIVRTPPANVDEKEDHQAICTNRLRNSRLALIFHQVAVGGRQKAGYRPSWVLAPCVTPQIRSSCNALAVSAGSQLGCPTSRRKIVSLRPRSSSEPTSCDNRTVKARAHARKKAHSPEAQLEMPPQ